MKRFCSLLLTAVFMLGLAAPSYAASTKAQNAANTLYQQGLFSGTDFQWDKAWELSDKIGLTCGEYNSKTTSFTRGDVAIISLSAHTVQETLATAPYWGLPSDIRWISNPETDDDLNNNILYCFLFGNYSLHIKNTFPGLDFKQIAQKMRSHIKSLSRTYPELVGVVSNTYVGCGSSPDDVFIDFPRSTLSLEDMYTQQMAALDTALEIKDSLHAAGTITDTMSQKQIAQAYYDYLRQLGVAQGGGPEAAELGQSVEYDSPYACLVNKKADCVGRAGAFNLLMHLEGISAQGVTGMIKGSETGHILSRVILDGETYYCDWGNNYPIAKNNDAWFIFMEF